MAERATIFQAVQIGVEVTPGTSVAANKKLPGLSIEPGIAAEVNKYRPVGGKFATAIVPGKEWTRAKLSGPITYNELPYILSSVMSYAAPVQQAATIAWKWTHGVAQAAADAIKTYTVEQGDSVRAHKFTYGLATGVELSFSREAAELSGEMIGKALSDGITMTAAPTEIAMVPVLPTQVDIYLADTYAGLAGASAMTRPLSATFSIGNRFKPLFPLATAGGTGFAATVETEPEAEIKLKVEADAEGMALLTQLRAGSSKFVRIKAVGALIASTFYYTLQAEMCVGVDEPSEFEDEDGVYALEWTLPAKYDSTWGKALSVEVTNTITAL